MPKPIGPPAINPTIAKIMAIAICRDRISLLNLMRSWRCLVRRECHGTGLSPEAHMPLLCVCGTPDLNERFAPARGGEPGTTRAGGDAGVAAASAGV